MKKITFFICTLSSGGAEHQLAILSSMLADRGYDINIVTYGENNEADHYSVPNSVKRVRIADGKSKIQKFIGIWRYFLNHKTDCIISFDQRNNFLVSLPLILRRKHIKFICGERNLSVEPIGLIEKILFNIVYRRVDYIVPNSHSQHDYIQYKYPYLKDKLVTITNYTNPTQYDFFPPTFTNVIKIGVLARYSPQKNYKNFAEAIKIVKATTSIKFEIHWYGRKQMAPNKFEPSFLDFQKIINANSLEDIIVLHDHVKDTISKFHEWDAFCLPSLHEGFSNALSEAICCGKPIIASNVSDNKYMVYEGVNGFLFDPSSPQSMADAIINYLELSNEEKSHFANESRRIALSLFDSIKFINSYEKLLAK